MNVERIYEQKWENNKSIFKIIKYKSNHLTKLWAIKLVQKNLENVRISGLSKISAFSELRKYQNYLDLENFHTLQNLEIS